MNKPDGYRYLRQYWRGNDHNNYALFEVQNGRAQRVGTARDYETGLRFISYIDQEGA